MPGGAEGWHVGREKLQWWLHPLHITQQWCLASVAVWVSSTSIPGFGFPPSSPLRLSPHRQEQSSLRVCSPVPTFQLSAPVCTSTHMSQSGMCRAEAQTVCVSLTLSCLTQTVNFTLLQQPQKLPFCPNQFPHQ